MKLKYFKDLNFLQAIKALLNELKLPVNYISDEPTTAKEILDYTYKDNETFQLIGDVYFVGMVDDAAFEGNDSFDHKKIKSDYDGILFFGVELAKRENNLLPTRTQLADIARAFNREFHFTPVVVVFKYANENESFICFANTERIKYKQEWREGEKAGKVSLLRDISIEKPHRGHEDIINALRITTSGKKAIRSFDELYKYWQEVFNVNILNKKFYQELSNWYFWSIKNVTFPSEPTLDDVIEKYGKADHDKLPELINEHNATNVIRLLTRLLFTWFIKEKKLIPESLFDLDALQDDILKEINPHQQEGMFKHANTDSIYYKAILQNLFFASLNCPIESDSVDKRKRGFRGEGYGTHRGIDYLMRYKKQFKNPDAFLDLMNETVPFLNGGLFECLDDKYQNIYIDGFSDQMTQGQQLIVPDFLFFGLDTEVDLSQDYGSKNAKYKKAAVKGLINILKSYKFTVTENTPVEEDVALDPELLGKVFENLLASYNPETKTTARKQTGSFYTPREIVSYMVDESLIAYLKNKILEEDEHVFIEIGEIQTNLFGNSGKSGQLTFQTNPTASEFKNNEEILDSLLHHLVSYDPGNPFAGYPETTKRILYHIDKCKILDPACGSGAFPMGILQKMVHILQKLDPTNDYWKEVQLNKAIKASEEAYSIEDKNERENRLVEINNAFDRNINDPDYARKLYLIENCIYGVDIQPIASQISKLRFFISLVVDQKFNPELDNFGIRPLPNLETKFVTANSLIRIDKPNEQTNLYDTDSIKLLEKELKNVRKRLFGARTKDTKLKYRKKDEELRNAIAEELKKSGWQNKTADNLASWDPYDQNTSAVFFDPEWMFDVKTGYDIVIGNPPYIEFKKLTAKEKAPYLKYTSATGKFDIYVIFIERGLELSKIDTGILCYINPTTFMRKDFGVGIRDYLRNYSRIQQIHDFVDIQVFEGATNYTGVFIIENTCKDSYDFEYHKYDSSEFLSDREFYNELNSKKNSDYKNLQIIYSTQLQDSWEFIHPSILRILNLCDNNSFKLKDLSNAIFQGIASGKDEVFYINDEIINTFNLEKNILIPLLKGKDIKAFHINWSSFYVLYPYDQNGNLIKEESLKEGFPNIYNYLLAKRKLLEGRTYFEKSNKAWYELWNQRKVSNFNKERIVTTEISSKNNFIITDKYFGNTKTYHIILKEPSYNNYVLGLLNSKLIEYYYQNITTPQAGGFYAYKTQFLNRRPIRLNSKYINAIATLALLLRYDPSNKTLKRILDATVISLYLEDHLSEINLSVFNEIDSTIRKTTNESPIENMTKGHIKEYAIELTKVWNSPESAVRNNIKLFAIKSPEILKPILE